MAKTSLLAVVLLAGSALAAPLAARQGTGTRGGAVNSFYDLETMTLDGKPGNLAQYKGKVSLVVNVASKCGYTPQYGGLEKLQREMKDRASMSSGSRATISVVRSLAPRRKSRRSAGSPMTSRSPCSRRW